MWTIGLNFEGQMLGIELTASLLRGHWKATGPTHFGRQKLPNLRKIPIGNIVYPIGAPIKPIFEWAILVLYLALLSSFQ